MELRDINLKKIQYFIAIVETGTLSKAADTLYVTQPLLSKNMKELESNLGIKLFVRNQRKLEVSDTGKFLYKKWKVWLQEFESINERAMLMQNYQNKEIRMGCEYIMVLAANDLWVPQVDCFHHDHPNYQVKTITAGLDETIKKFLNGEIDIMICSRYDLTYLNGPYHEKLLSSSPVYLYTSAANPIMRKKNITWVDLHEQEFMTISPSVLDWPIKLLQDYAHKAGFEPIIAGYTNTQMSQLLDIKTSNRLMLSIAFPDLIHDPKIGAIPMEDKTDIMIVWKKEAEPYVHVLSEYMLKK